MDMLVERDVDSLFSLPLEVVAYIFSFLNTPELLQCAPLCSYVCDVILKQPIVWKYLNFRSLGIVFPLHLKSVLGRTKKNNVALLSMRCSVKQEKGAGEEVLQHFLKNNTGLKCLDLSSNVVLRYSSFDAICGCQELVYLDVCNTWIANENIEGILKACPNLTSLKMSNCSWLWAPAILDYVIVHGQNLQNIEIKQPKAKVEDDPWLVACKQLPKLKSLTTPKGNVYKREDSGGNWTFVRKRM